MSEATTLGGDPVGKTPTRTELEQCVKTVIGAVGVCGLLRLVHVYFKNHPNPGRYNSYPAISQLMMICEGMVRRETVDLDDDEDDAVNDEFEIERYEQYGLLLHQLEDLGRFPSKEWHEKRIPQEEQ